MIEYFEISNFKSLYEVKLHLRPFNVLIGPNNSGKSNFIDALNFLREMARGRTVIDSLIRSRTNILDAFFSGFKENSEISIRLIWKEGKQGEYFDYEVILTLKKEDDLPVVSSESLKSRVKKGKKTRVLKILSRKDNIATLINPSRIKLKGMKWNIDQHKLAIYQLGNNDELAKRFQNIIASFWFFNPVPTAIRAPVPLDKIVAPYHREGFGLAETLYYIKSHPKAKKNFSQIQKAFSSIVDDIKTFDVILAPDKRAFLLFNEETLNFGFSSKLASDGTLRVLAMITAIFAPESPAIMAIEEPENCIHVRRVNRLISLLQERSLGYENIGSTQIFITTHSPYLLDLVEPEEIILTDRPVGKTAFLPLSSMKGKMPHIQKSIEEGDTLGEIWIRGSLGAVPKEKF